MARREVAVSPHEEGAVQDPNVGTLDSVFAGGGVSQQQVEVSRPQAAPMQNPRGPKMYRVRIAKDLEEVSHNSERFGPFEAGEIVDLPWYVCQELERTGNIWH